MKNPAEFYNLNSKKTAQTMGSTSNKPKVKQNSTVAFLTFFNKLKRILTRIYFQFSQKNITFSTVSGPPTPL